MDIGPRRTLWVGALDQSLLCCHRQRLLITVGFRDSVHSGDDHIEAGERIILVRCMSDIPALCLFARLQLQVDYSEKSVVSAFLAFPLSICSSFSLQAPKQNLLFAEGSRIHSPGQSRVLPFRLRTTIWENWERRFRCTLIRR